MTTTELKEEVKNLLALALEQDIEYFTPAAFMDAYYDTTFFDLVGISVKTIEEVGGEDQGDIYYTIISFTKENKTVFARFNGYYSSYLGATFQDWEFVEPKEKTITVYSPVGQKQSATHNSASI